MVMPSGKRGGKIVEQAIGEVKDLRGPIILPFTLKLPDELAPSYTFNEKDIQLSIKYEIRCTMKIDDRNSIPISKLLVNLVDNREDKDNLRKGNGSSGQLVGSKGAVPSLHLNHTGHP